MFPVEQLLLHVWIIDAIEGLQVRDSSKRRLLLDTLISLLLALLRLTQTGKRSFILVNFLLPLQMAFTNWRNSTKVYKYLLPNHFASHLPASLGYCTYAHSTTGLLFNYLTIDLPATKRRIFTQFFPI